MLSDIIIPATPAEVKDKDFKLDLVTAKTGKLFVFHNKPFSQDLGWVEFHYRGPKKMLKMLDFILNDGTICNFGIKIPEDMHAKMLETTQIQVVMMDVETRKPLSGGTYSLVAHTT